MGRTHLPGRNLYYVAYEMRDHYGFNQESPVLNISFVNKLVQSSEALSVYQNSGNFAPLLPILGIDTQKAEELYFKLEMNRQPRQSLRETKEFLDTLAQNQGFRGEIAAALKRELQPLQEMDYLDERMVERAKLFYQKKQYLKALVLLFEGLNSFFARKYRIGDPQNYDTAEEVAKRIRSGGITVDSTD